MATIGQFIVKDDITIRDDMLRTVKNGLIERGVTDPQVGPSTDWYLTATAVSRELAVIGANNQVKCDAQMPDTAIDDDLVRIGDLLDIEAQPAGGSVGPVIMNASATSPVVTGAQLYDTAGLRYEVVTGNNYNNGDPVTIRALDVGDSTNHPEGDVLQWKAAPPFADSLALVGPGGLINGAPAEDNEVLRQRVFSRFQNPTGSGNWQTLVEDAEDSTPRVQKGFCYPAVQGPATMDVAATAAPTLTNKSRQLAALVVSSEVNPYIQGKHPGHAQLTVTTVTDVPTDLSVALALPEAVTANPPGPGGGWVDGNPWPRPDGVTTFRCSVTAVTSSTVFTVDATEAPQVGVNRIAWLSPFDWTLRTALVIGSFGSTGNYTITVDEPFTGIAIDCVIWPECENAQAYCDAVLDEYALMGPGEKTTNVSALLRGFRHPVPTTSWRYTLGAHLLRSVTSANDEVDTAQFLYRSDGTTTLTTPGGQVVPVPTPAYGPPPIYIPRHIGFYRLP